MILCMALCGSLSFCSAPSKAATDKEDQEITEIEIYEHDEHGGTVHATLIRTVVTPISPDPSPKSMVTDTPGNTPAESPKAQLVGTQPNQIVPIPATTPHRILITSNPLATLEFEFNKMRVAASAAAALAVPKPAHVRAQSGQVNVPLISIATAAVATGCAKPNVELQKKPNS